jgi:beta-carotene ketolase (CrtO type)
MTMSFALKERPRRAAEKFDPDLVHSSMGMMGPQTVKELIHAFGERAAGRFEEVPMVTYSLPYIDDPTQTREGNCVANTYWEVPYALYEKGGAQIWDDKDFRREIAEKVLTVWETYFPGFRENLLDYWMTTPLDMERLNMNYFRGDDNGGSIAAPQMFYGNRANIEGFDKGGVVTPIKSLYGSGAVGPAWTNGGNGYRAACHIADELGIRNQPWWTHRCFEYLTKKYIEKTYVPLKATSILDR